MRSRSAKAPDRTSATQTEFKSPATSAGLFVSGKELESGSAQAAADSNRQGQAGRPGRSDQPDGGQRFRVTASRSNGFISWPFAPCRMAAASLHRIVLKSAEDNRRPVAVRAASGYRIHQPCWNRHPESAQSTMMKSGIDSVHSFNASSLFTGFALIHNRNPAGVRFATFRIELESSMIRHCFIGLLACSMPDPGDTPAGSGSSARQCPRRRLR